MMSPVELITKAGPLETLTGKPTHYCPGCEHGTLTRLLAATISELGIRERVVMVDSVGCSVLAYEYLNFDHVVAAHGRAPAVMTGIKRTHPELIVFSVQGDGDALAIGLLELVYAAVRSEPITIFLVNNAIYGMTGGQMAPTTPAGLVTTTTPTGRDTALTGKPLDACKLLAAVDGAAYIRRIPLTVSPVETRRGILWQTKNIHEARRILRNAFEVQMRGGFAFVELLSSCNVNWKMSILDSKKFVADTMMKLYPPGVYRDVYGVEQR